MFSAPRQHPVKITLDASAPRGQRLTSADPTATWEDGERTAMDHLTREGSSSIGIRNDGEELRQANDRLRRYNMELQKNSQLQEEHDALMKKVALLWNPCNSFASTAATDGMLPMMPSSGYGSFPSPSIAPYPTTEESGGVWPASPADRLTTVVMKNIPNDYTRDQLLGLLHREGYNGSFDFLYLPIDFETRVGFGYAFINFRTHDLAEKFHKHFTDFSGWVVSSDKVCKVTWSSNLQGMDALIARFTNSPLTHESVPDEFKPMRFDARGARMDFPKL